MSQRFANPLVRLGVIALAVTAIACITPTAPKSPVQNRKTAVHDDDPIEGDTLLCHNGWNVIMGRYVCSTGG